MVSWVRQVVLAVAVLSALGALACESRVAGGQVDGAAVFKAACARCHGDAGAPDPGMVAQLGVANLTDPALHARLRDADIDRQIREGSKNGKMPAFGSALTDEQIEAVVAYVRTLEKDGPAQP